MRQRQPEDQEQIDSQTAHFLRIAVVIRLTGLGRSTIYRKAFIRRPTKVGRTHRCRWRRINLVGLNRRSVVKCGALGHRAGESATTYGLRVFPRANSAASSRRKTNQA